MISFLSELRKRNGYLYWFGWYNFILGIICVSLMQFDTVQLLGINRWIKPMKFFFSVGIMVWTMDWLMHYLDNKRKVVRYSWLIIISMFVENFIIFLQAARGTTSHFNIQTTFDSIMFEIMGLFILLFAITSILIAGAFLRQKQFSIPASYLWGIRIGLIFFILFSIEGGMMLSRMGHTVGAADGSVGLPIVNWSRQYGDLRIAHFFGMHSLQILPLAGYYIFKKPSALIVFSIIYFFAISFLLILALKGIPFMKF
ncbi:MAG: hypothetical protein M3O67_08065 [Bacteroidota bacterium]|nr:hypothetical protein [Bacteroidota bacterium]